MPGIVDEAVDRAELVAQRFHEGRDRVDLAEIAGAEADTATGGFKLRDRRAQLLALAARHRDHVIA